MKKLTILLSIASLVFLITGTAGAIPITATLTADNHYALYSGNEQGISFVGANESGWYGNPGTYNWSEAETFDLDVALGDYIYVAAWSDDRVAQGLLGQFVFDSGSILTNTSGWEAYLTSNDLDDGDAPPSASEIESEISTAEWSPITHSVSHGAGPWKFIDGINNDAQWIWGSELLSGSNYGEYQVFRSEIGDAPAHTPVPATMLLLSSGLIGLVGLGRKKLFKKS